MTPQEKIFAAVKALPRPITEEMALEAAVAELEFQPVMVRQFNDWFKSNGAQWIKLLNAG